MPKLREFQKNIVIKPSRIKGAGLGVFAKQDIPKYTRLGWYRGDMITRKEWINLDDDSYSWLIHDEYDTEFYVDGKNIKKDNKLRYVNGFKTPSQMAFINVEAYQKYDRIWYKTCRKIRKGEELIVDYGGDYWTPVEV